MSKVVRQMKQELAGISSKDVHRAVIFQGGGAIGAYAAGVYAVLYHWVKKDIVENENVFDVNQTKTGWCLMFSERLFH